MTAPEFLSRLDGVTVAGDGRWMARCPTHEDGRPSLSVSSGQDGRVLVNCFAGCTPEAIVAALGLGMADLMPARIEKPKVGKLGRIVATYPYHDENGALLFEVVRYEPKDFRQRRPDPSARDGWSWSTKSIRKVLFRLPEILAAVGKGLPIWIVEGEKDALAIVSKGQEATCNPGGAGKWLPDYSKALRGAHVVVVADKDTPGREHARKVADSLHAVVASIRVIEVPDIDGTPCKDPADFLGAGGEIGELVAIADETMEWAPGIGPSDPMPRNGESHEHLTPAADPLPGNDEPSDEASSVKPFTIWSPRQFIEWTEPPGLHLLLPAFVTSGELTAIVGQGGLGKSRLALWLAVSQIVGREWCGLKTGGDPARWLMLGNENGLSRIKADLAAIFGTLSHDEQQAVEERLRLQAIVTLEDGLVDLGDESVRDRLAETVKQAAPGAVIIDPLANFIPGDLNKPSDMRDGIRTLFRIIREHAPGAAIIILHHARTGRQNIAQGVGFDAANFALGAKTLFNACRAVINLMPASEDDDTRLVVACAKASNCRRFDPVGLRFDPKTFTYDADPDFDLDRWRDDVDGKRSGSSCGIADIVNAVRNGERKAGEIADTVSESTGAKRRTVEKYLRIAVQKRYLETPFRGQYTLGPKSNTI